MSNNEDFLFFVMMVIALEMELKNVGTLFFVHVMYCFTVTLLE